MNEYIKHRKKYCIDLIFYFCSKEYTGNCLFEMAKSFRYFNKNFLITIRHNSNLNEPKVSRILLMNTDNDKIDNESNFIKL